MFGLDTKETLPPSFLTDHDAWDDYVGHIWYGVLFLSGLKPDSTVIEIGPGASVKIAQALARLRYKGVLHVVDASSAVLESLKPRYEALLPDATIQWVSASLPEGLDRLPKRPGFILGSHIIDDMLLFHADRQSAQWASSYTFAPDEIVHKTWRALESNPQRLVQARDIVKKDILQIFAALDPACAVLSQYPSSTLTDHDMGTLNDNASTIFDAVGQACASSRLDHSLIQAILNTNKNYGNAHIGKHVLDARYWLSCRFRTN